MRKRWIVVLSLGLIAITTTTACNRKLLYSRDREMEPISKLFPTAIDEAFRVAKESLIRLGYRIERENPTEATLQTGWLSTKASSHYIDLFDHRDYGTVGAYYRLEVKVAEKEGKAEVEVSAPVRSIIGGRLRSSHREEKKVLKKMADLLRRSDFEMSNVGVEE